jgi:hypothetical protein
LVGEGIGERRVDELSCWRLGRGKSGVRGGWSPEGQEGVDAEKTLRYVEGARTEGKREGEVIGGGIPSGRDAHFGKPSSTSATLDE